MESSVTVFGLHYIESEMIPASYKFFKAIFYKCILDK